MISTARRQLLVYFVDSSGLVVKVTVGDNRWDPGLFGCGGTPISCVSGSLSDRAANWFGDARMSLPPPVSEVGPFCVSARCSAKILRVNTG